MSTIVLSAGTASGVPETLGETQQRQPGRSPFEAFDNLPDDLHITIASEPGSAAVRTLSSFRRRRRSPACKQPADVLFAGLTTRQPATLTCKTRSTCRATPLL